MRFLGDTKGTGNLAGANAILGTWNEPNSRQRFLKASGESSKMVPIFAVNWRLVWLLLHYHFFCLAK